MLILNFNFKRRTFDPGPEAFMIRLCEKVFINKAKQYSPSQRSVQTRRLTLSTSAGEQTVVATVPLKVQIRN